MPLLRTFYAIARGLVILRCDERAGFKIAPIRALIDLMMLGRIGLGCALGMTLYAGAAHADVTAVYGCRFYVDGKVYAEFRIDEIDHTEWAYEGLFDPPQGKPVKTEVEAEGSLAADDALRFVLPEQQVEIAVADTLDFVNARYSGPVMKDLPGECEQAETSAALNRWFLERERQHKRGSR